MGSIKDVAVFMNPEPASARSRSRSRLRLLTIRVGDRAPVDMRTDWLEGAEVDETPVQAIVRIGGGLQLPEEGLEDLSRRQAREVTSFPELIVRSDGAADVAPQPLRPGSTGIGAQINEVKPPADLVPAQ